MIHDYNFECDESLKTINLLQTSARFNTNSIAKLSATHFVNMHTS